jgi:hypothetical protein
MKLWAEFSVLQLSFVLVVMGVGYPAAGRLLRACGVTQALWIDRVCAAALLMVAGFAVAGLGLSMLPWGLRTPVASSLLLALVAAAAGLWVKAGVWRDFLQASRAEKTFFAGFMALATFALAVGLVPVKLPDPLMDGPYVAKHDYLGVRVQRITGDLPADNSIPHVASEYLLRDIPFTQERPMLPGQEVANRPILVSLALVPLRAAFSMPPKQEGPLPRFTYVGTSWPDFSVLMKDDFAYLFSLSIGALFNALLVLATGAFAVRATRHSVSLAGAVVALMLTSPYFIFQTIFTWPKELAAFFVLFSVIARYRLESPVLAGVSLGLAYLSHPYAVVFLAGFGLHATYTALSDGRIRPEAIAFVRFFAAFVLAIAPWFIWTRWIVEIPSDLISQNFQAGGARMIDMLWVRMTNLLNTMLPMHLLGESFSLVRTVIAGTVTVPGAIGTLVFMFGLLYIGVNLRTPQRLHFFLLGIPSLLLIGVFSNLAVPALHGLQGPIALMLVVSVMQMRQSLYGWLFAAALAVQLAANVLLLGRYLSMIV